MKSVPLVFLIVIIAVASAQEKASPARAALAVDPATYVIGAQDVLQISVWQEPELSAPSVPVRPDGMISLPLLSDVQASGLTPTQLSAALRDRMQKLVQEPQVTVIVTAINSKRIYILGEVTRPGPMPLLSDMTILQAISTAGGLSQYANAKNIYVLRTENGSQVRMHFNYKTALKGKDPKQEIALRPGDTIVVP
jgi:polysaccharide export outer membrane protein